MLRIPTTAAGYELAIDTLKRRFGRIAPVLNLRLTELVEMKPLSDDCSTADLRKMLDIMSVRVLSLLSLGLSEKGEGLDWTNCRCSTAMGRSFFGQRINPY